MRLQNRFLIRKKWTPKYGGVAEASKKGSQGEFTDKGESPRSFQGRHKIENKLYQNFYGSRKQTLFIAIKYVVKKMVVR